VLQGNFHQRRRHERFAAVNADEFGNLFGPAAFKSKDLGVTEGHDHES
jgi:hypothetical protein